MCVIIRIYSLLLCNSIGYLHLIYIFLIVYIRDFTCYAISSMGNKLMSGVFRGRPFGGVAFLCRKTIAGKIQVIASDDNGRCLCLSLKYDTYKLIKWLTVYLPCYESGPDHFNELDRCLGFINDVINVGDEAIFLGNFNFPCDMSHKGFSHCCAVFNQLGIFNCCENDGYTYLNNSLGQGSFIDHFFVSNSLRSIIQSISIIDSGANLSDHRPVIATFKQRDLVFSGVNDTFEAHNTAAHLSRACAWRWDKAYLNNYYESTRLALADIEPPRVCLTCNTGCKSLPHRSSIDVNYRSC